MTMQTDTFTLEIPLSIDVATDLKTYAVSLGEQETLAHTLRKRAEGLPFLRFLARGNQSLLHGGTLVPVRVSRSATQTDIQNLQNYILAGGAQKQLVVISSFVSRGERHILDLAIEARVPIIFLAQFDISDQSKIPAALLPSLREGRLLLLAPWPKIRTQSFFVRSQCLLINRISEILSDQSNAAH